MNEQEAAAAESSNVTSLDSAREKILSVGPNEENDDGYELDPVDEESSSVSDDEPISDDSVESMDEPEQAPVVSQEDPRFAAIFSQLETIAKAIATPKEQAIPEVKVEEPFPERDFSVYWTNEDVRKREMLKFDLDPKNILDQIQYRNIIAVEAERYERKRELHQLQAKIDKFNETFSTYQQEQQAAPIIKQTVSLFKQYEAKHTIPKSVARPLQSRVAELIQEGSQPEAAIKAAFKEFSDVVKAKKEEKKLERDPVKVKVQQAAAIVGQGNNSNIKASGGAKRGSTESLESLRTSLFRSGRG